MNPILFNTEMVRAILEDRKTVTRRVVKPQPPESTSDVYFNRIIDGVARWGWRGSGALCDRTPPYRPGDILYVRETWCDPSGTGYPFLYKADMPMHWDAEDTETGVPVDLKVEDYKWRPSIHMPREAARIFLRVTDIRVERLQKITEEQAQAEGVKGWMVAADRDWDKNPNCILAFRHAWNSTLKKSDRDLYGWDANPWVWVIEFERCGKPEGDWHGNGVARRKKEGSSVLDDRKIEKASLDLWLLERGESNQEDLNRLKRAIPIVMKECCTEKQALYIARFFVDRMKMKDIAAFYGVNKSVVSRTINRGLKNLYDYLRFCSPDLVSCTKRKGRITQKKVGGT